MLTDKQIASIMLEQLGGSRFLAMTGAKNLMSGDRTLSMHIPLSNGINRVSITLDIDDTYRVTFTKFNARNLRTTIIHTASTVYADQLQTLFTEQTGLRTRL